MAPLPGGAPPATVTAGLVERLGRADACRAQRGQRAEQQAGRGREAQRKGENARVEADWRERLPRDFAGRGVSDSTSAGRLTALTCRPVDGREVRGHLTAVLPPHIDGDEPEGQGKGQAKRGRHEANLSSVKCIYARCI